MRGRRERLKKRLKKLFSAALVLSLYCISLYLYIYILRLYIHYSSNTFYFKITTHYFWMYFMVVLIHLAAILLLLDV